MTTLDQVHLLEEKVESAVAKLQQLQAENDALRKKCLELTNALSSKSEQLSNFSTDKSEIEDGIKKALDRLSYIENSVLKTAEPKKSSDQAPSPSHVATQQHTPVHKTVVDEVVAPQPVVEKKMNTPQSIQITPGISKINEEELNKVQQINSVTRTSSSPVTKNPVTQNVAPVNQHTVINNQYQTSDVQQQSVNQASYTQNVQSEPLSFDTMDMANGFSPDDGNVEDESYEFDNSESFDDMEMDNAFNIFEEAPSQGKDPKAKEIIF